MGTKQAKPVTSEQLAEVCSRKNRLRMTQQFLMSKFGKHDVNEVYENIYISDG